MKIITVVICSAEFHLRGLSTVKVSEYLPQTHSAAWAPPKVSATSGTESAISLQTIRPDQESHLGLE